MKVVIDTNVFIACLNPSSSYHLIIASLVEGKYKLCISTEITFEYLEVFQRKFKNEKTDAFFMFLEESLYVQEVEVYFKWKLIEADVDDNKFVDCALAGGADYIVTFDAHFNELRKNSFPKVEVITPDDFIEILSK